MDYGTVGTGAFAGLAFMVAFGFIFPITIAIVWLVKKKEKISSVLVGALIFVVFALGLESIPKYFLLQSPSAISEYIMSHAWSFALVGAGLAGVFEETGRWIAFKFILKKRNNRETAISYGIGHGGIEALILLGVSSFQYILYAVMINAGTFGTIVDQVALVSPDQVEAIEGIATALTAMTFTNAFAGCFERIFAMLGHVAWSVMVFKAVKEKKSWYFFPIAILLHMGMDIFAALYQFGIITNVIAVELLIAVTSCAIAVWAYKLYKKMN